MKLIKLRPYKFKNRRHHWEQKPIHISDYNFSSFSIVITLKWWFVIYSFRTCLKWLEKRVKPLNQSTSNPITKSCGVFARFRNDLVASPCICVLIGWKRRFIRLVANVESWLVCVCVCINRASFTHSWNVISVRPIPNYFCKVFIFSLLKPNSSALFYIEFVLVSWLICFRNASN